MDFTLVEQFVRVSFYVLNKSNKKQNQNSTFCQKPFNVRLYLQNSIKVPWMYSCCKEKTTETQYNGDENWKVRKTSR